MRGPAERLLAGVSAYGRNLERGFKILLEGESPGRDRLLAEAVDEALAILGHDRRGEIEELVASLPSEAVENAYTAMEKAIADLTTPTGALGAAAISILMGKAGVEGKPEIIKRLFDAVKSLRDGVTVEEAVEYLSATAVEVVRELPEFESYRKIDQSLDEADLTPHAEHLVPAPFNWLGKAVGAGPVTGRFLALEIVSFGGVIGLSEALERLERSRVGAEASKLIKGLEVGAPVLLYVLGEIAEAGDRTALALPLAAAWLASED